VIENIKTAFAAMTACGLILSVTHAGALDIQDRTLKIAVTNTAGNPHYDGAQKLADLVIQKSGGKIQAKVFGGAVLGKDVQVLSSMQGGMIDMSMMNTNLLVGIAKEAGLVDLPYLFESEKEAYAVLDGPVGKKIHAAFESKGLVGLGYFDMGYYSLHNNIRPINRIEDVKGMKMRVTETPVTIETFKAFGANPVPLPYPELYNALEQKVVDGGGQPPLNMYFGKIGEVQKFYSLNRYSYTPMSILLSKRTWDKFSADEKKIIRDAAQEASNYQREMSLKKSAECVKNIEATTAVNQITPMEMARFREAVMPVVDKFSKLYNEDLAKEMFAEIAKYRAGKN